MNCSNCGKKIFNRRKNAIYCKFCKCFYRVYNRVPTEKEYSPEGIRELHEKFYPHSKMIDGVPAIQKIEGNIN